MHRGNFSRLDRLVRSAFVLANLIFHTGYHYDPSHESSEQKNKSFLRPEARFSSPFNLGAEGPTPENNFYTVTGAASWCGRTFEMRCLAGVALAGGLSGACAVELCAGGGGTIAKSISPSTIIPRIAMITMFQCRKLTTLFVRSPCGAGRKYHVCGSDSREEYLRSYMDYSLPGAGSSDQSGTHPTLFMRRIALRYGCSGNDTILRPFTPPVTASAVFGAKENSAAGEAIGATQSPRPATPEPPLMLPGFPLR